MPYDGDPVNKTSDAVRMLLRDTSTSAPLLTDNEVDWLLGTHPSVYLAAAAGAEMVAAKWAAGVVTTQVGDLRITKGTGGAGGPSEQYRLLATQFRLQAARSDGFTLYSGGVSKSDKQAQREDTDWDKVDVALKQDDNRYGNSTDGIWRGY
jgi:hypothetical protein